MRDEGTECLSHQADLGAKAVVALAGVADQDDRDVIEGDLATLPI